MTPTSLVKSLYCKKKKKRAKETHTSFILLFSHITHPLIDYYVMVIPLSQKHRNTGYLATFVPESYVELEFELDTNNAE